MPIFALALLACQEPKVPEDALTFDVEVTAGDIDGDGLADTCHPDATEGWQDSFVYSVVFETAADGTIATIVYVGDTVFATGTMMDGCKMSYQTVVTGEDTEADGEVRWQLFGESMFDRGDDACAEGEGDWIGTEWFEVVSSTEETLPAGCTYEMTTAGTYLPAEE